MQESDITQIPLGWITTRAWVYSGFEHFKYGVSFNREWMEKEDVRQS